MYDCGIFDELENGQLELADISYGGIDNEGDEDRDDGRDEGRDENGNDAGNDGALGTVGVVKLKRGENGVCIFANTPWLNGEI